MFEKKGLFLVITLVLFLNLLGIKWGLPKNDYLLFYQNKEGKVPLTEETTQDYLQKSWDKSRQGGEEKIPRSAFNIIRSFHPDEHNIIKSISNMKPINYDFNPHFFEYPSFFIYFVAVLIFSTSLSGFTKITSDLSFYYANPWEIGKFFLIGRLGVIILSTLGIYLIYKTTENFFDKRRGLLSSIILASTPLYIINSHFMTVDIPMVFWIILFLYFLSLYWKKDKIRFLYLASVSIGFATGTKYPAIFIFSLLPIIYLSKERRLRKVFFLTTLKSFVVTILTFFLTTPYALLSWNEFKRDVFYQISVRGVTSNLSIWQRISGLTINTSVVALSGFCLLTVIFIAGIIYSIFKKGKEKFFLVGLILSLLPLIFAGGLKYGRYYLIILPFVTIMAASCLATFLESKKNRNFFARFIIFIIIFIPFIKSFAYSLQMTKKDSRISMAEYIEKEIPHSSTIVFTKDPWIFEVPPVNTGRYNVVVSDKENLDNLKEGSYLLIGELQYFLKLGSRKKNESVLLSEIEGYGYKVEKIFKNPLKIGNFKFDSNITVHDMIYTHPAIYLFRKI